MKQDRFFELERTPVKTAEGTVQLPILYLDFSSVIFLFFVKPNLVEPLLDGSGFKPCIFANGRAMVILVFFEYRDSSIGSYNEVGLCSATYSTKKKKPFLFLPDLLKKGDKWQIASYVHNLPVTTSLANAAGRTIWGYPKFVTDIKFSLSKKSFHGKVMDPDSNREILSIGGAMGKMGTGTLLPSIDIVTHTVKNGEQVHTVITTDGKMNYNLWPSMRLQIGDGDHPMTQNLRRLDLHQRKPFVMGTSYNGRSILPEGNVIK